ncbi:MAG: flagellar hook assembly protein FlgD [Desulfobulbaceae bacterium]|nr:flagellar hook assembly protein FlgD [Desulfobulbaceae bacterium]
MTVSTVSNTIPMYQEESLYKPVGKSELDRQDFMTLFITQLQYQDPMKPMDSYEMASQLAQFSNMEATMKMADNMEELLEYQTSQNNLQLLTLLDKDVRILGNEIGVNGDEQGIGEFTLLDNADTCVVEIYDSGEHLVRSLNLGSMSADTYTLDWDGQDSLGEDVADGAYGYVVKAYDITGQEIGIDYQTVGKVTGLDFDSGKARLVLDNYIDADVGAVIGVN